MNIKRFLICISIVTVLCLLYIHQQTQIIKLAYEGKKKLDTLSELIDKKDILVYNIDVLQSMPNINLNLLSKQNDFEIAKEFRIVKLNEAETTIGKFRLKPIFGRLLSFRLPWLERQAEAKTIDRP